MSYCDSQQYSNKVVSDGSNQYLNFISKIVKHGITSSTYTERADIIINKMNPPLKLLEYNTTLAVCDSTVGKNINVMLNDSPSIIETIKCTFKDCELNKKSPQSIVNLTYETTDGKIRNLQQFLNDRLNSKTSACKNMFSGKQCNGTKEIISNISEKNLFIEVLYWEGNYFIIIKYFVQHV